MSENSQLQDQTANSASAQPSDKEINFNKMRQQLEMERSARLQTEQKMAEYEKKFAQLQQNSSDHDESGDEPYVDHKRLEKKFRSFEQQMDEKIEKRAEEKARSLMEREKQNQWMRNNPDFYDVMQHAEKFAQTDPELAETILNMPEGFDRQKLVYKNIKALKLHEPPKPQSTIQEKVDANRRSPYYHPGDVGAAPYAQAGDYSPSGQKNAYEKMKQLQKQLRI